MGWGQPKYSKISFGTLPSESTNIFHNVTFVVKLLSSDITIAHTQIANSLHPISSHYRNTLITSFTYKINQFHYVTEIL